MLESKPLNPRRQASENWLDATPSPSACKSIAYGVPTPPNTMAGAGGAGGASHRHLATKLSSET
ncbi:MAG: hypothetical protein DMG39_26795 [Acidobacteria bacterium]|nr:MAG: hypothetical protein DMG39_26795 [Acidobacteriota bacterium]